MAEYKLCVDANGRKEPSIYENDEGWKYLRIRDKGKNLRVPLETKSLKKAVDLRDLRRGAQAASKLGLAVAPHEAAASAKVSVPVVIQRYQTDGYPSKKGVARKQGKHATAETNYCETLLEYFNGSAPAADLCQDDLDKYHAWRVTKVANGFRNGDGHRITDLELNTLNNAMRWAVRKKLLKTNPIANRARYHTVSDAKHCREFSVESADELHEVAGALMASRRSETLGWQLLVEGLTGLRTEEAVTLRMDARTDEPGGLTPDGGSLCVRRAKKSSRENPYVRVNKGLREVIAAHKIWHDQRYPLSPWYFPGRDRKTLTPIYKSVLTRALDRLFKTGVLKKKYTSHGAGRAFYVFARRSQGAGDPEIAFEINHTGGVGTLESVYALPPKHWRNGDAPGMPWVPKGAPAWSRIKKVDFSALDGATGAPSFEI